MASFQRSRIFSLMFGVLGLVSAHSHAQQVALLDSGVDPDAGFNIVPGFNYFNNIADTSDISDREGEGHGTVSTRVASEAFTGEIVPFIISDGNTGFTSSSATNGARDSALSDILGRPEVRVVGMSIGGPGISDRSAPLVSNLSNSGRIVAINAGNDINTQPNTLSTSSFNLDGVIIVGGTDRNGVLLPQANQAGTTANKYVGAIGAPTLDEGVATEASGSSWATARIAGIAGQVLLQNPNLTGSEVVDIILQSAEDRGAEGTDVVYGRGVILSAEQVLNNVIGDVEIPVIEEAVTDNGGGGGSSSGAGLILAGALAGGLFLLTRPKTELEKTLVLDSYGRAFEIDLTDRISVNDGVLHLNNFFQALEQNSINDAFSVPELNTQVAFSAAAELDHSVDMIEYFALPNDVILQDNAAQVSFSLASQLTQNTQLQAGHKVNADQAFGAVANFVNDETFGTSSFISGQSFGSVLSGFSAQADTASLNYDVGKPGKFSTKLGFVSVDQSLEFGQESFSSILEGKYDFNDKVGVSLQFGQIEEQGSVLGGSSGGVFGVDTSTTYAVNFSGHLKTSENFSFVANYGIGRTRVDAAEESLLSDFSRLDSNWYSLGMIGNDVFRDQDQIGFAFSQPLKIRSGSVNYSIPTDQDANFNIVFNSERVDLSATAATEHNLEAYYRTMLSDRLELGSFISYRDNPNHVSDQGNDFLMMATLKFRQ